MAGLLGDVLPWVYSQSDRMKRNLNGLLSDPLGSVEQTIGLLGDAGLRQQATMDRAFADPKSPFKVTDQNALAEASMGVLRGPLSFAPAGITVNAGVPYWHDPQKPPKLDQYGQVRDASRAGSMEWAGSNTPQARAESIAADMRRLLEEDWHNKDFDPSGVRQSLADWSAKEGLSLGVVYRSFIRELNGAKGLPDSARQMVNKAWMDSAPK